MIIAEKIKYANEILKKKFPPNSFFDEQDIIRLSEIDPTGNNEVLLYSGCGRFVSILENNLHLLDDCMKRILNIKSKAQIKREKQSLYYNGLRKDLHREVSDLFYKDKEFFKENTPLYKENFKFIRNEFKRLVLKMCKIKSDFHMLEEMSSHLNEKYSLFKKDLISLTHYNINHKLFEDNLNDEIDTLFHQKFFSNYLLCHSDIKDKFYNKISVPMNFYDQDCIIDFDLSYESSFVDSNFTNPKVVPILDKLGFVKNILLSKPEIENFIQNTFKRIIKDIPLIENDKLLKDSIFENYFGKITNISNRQRISISITIPDKIDQKKLLNKSKRNILKTVFDTNERRIFGFIRSVNRKVIQNCIEIDSFKNLFPNARKQNRKIHFLCGETNSGKTYTAFEEASKFKSGIYAAPLRLLALEGQQEFEKRGIECSMITGEERDIKDGATFISSTVEMIDYTKEYDVAIIDEVQLINDRDRGHAWFEAIVGINAKELYLVGSEDIDKVLKEIVEYLDEKINKRVFKRKTKIQFNKELYKDSIQNIGKLPPHSAVIAFSKSKVLKLKNKFEGMGNNVSVIYGALPPEIRRIETERFVNGETDVIISTDAIGMGLNLPIENIFFFEKEKYDGVSICNLEVHLIKQIVGRAGRFNKFDIGYVSAFDDSVFRFIQKEFYKDSTVSEKNLKCSPNYPIIKQLYTLTEEKSIFKLLQNYNNAINFDFDIKNHMNECAYKISRFIDKLDEENMFFDLKDKVKLINAPISNERSGEVLGFLKDCIQTLFILKKDSSIFPYDLLIEILNNLRTDSQKQIELSIKKIDVISWVSFNFEEFKDIKDEIFSKKILLNKKLINHLRD